MLAEIYKPLYPCWYFLQLAEIYINVAEIYMLAEIYLLHFHSMFAEIYSKMHIYSKFNTTNMLVPIHAC